MTATNKTVESMCLTMRHDFGLDKPIGDDFASQVASGMTDQERDALRRNMAQIYEHHIQPLEERVNEQDAILNSIRDAVGPSNPNRPLSEVVAELAQQNDALGRELLTPQVFSRLAEWLRNPKPASAAFTAGMERQIAYALEMDVLPEVKSLRIKLANAEKRAAQVDDDAVAENAERIRDSERNGDGYMSTSQLIMQGFAMCRPELLEEARYPDRRAAWQRLNDAQRQAIIEWWKI